MPDAHPAEDEIKDAFVKGVNAVFPEKDELTANTKVMMRTVCDTTKLEQSRLLTEMDAVTAMVKDYGGKQSCSHEPRRIKNIPQ